MADLGKGGLLVKKEFVWVDYAKAVAIWLVVYGHSGASGPAVDVWIHSFHMPVFFLISGFLLGKSSLELPFGSFLLKNFKALMVPYYIFAAIGFTFWLLVLRHFGSDAALDISPWEKVAGIFYATGSNGAMSVYPLVLWFFPCLFVAKAIAYVCLRHSIMKIAAMSLSLACGGFLLGSSVVLPFEAETALVAQLFVCIGCLSRRHMLMEKGFMRPMPTGILLVIFGTAAAYANNLVNFASNTLGNPVLFLAASLSLSFGLFSICSGGSERPVVTSIGRNTFHIFPIHPFVFSLFSGVYVFVFHLPLAFRAEPLVGILASFVNIGVILLALHVYEKSKMWFSLRARDFSQPGGDRQCASIPASGSEPPCRGHSCRGVCSAETGLSRQVVGRHGCTVRGGENCR